MGTLNAYSQRGYGSIKVWTAGSRFDVMLTAVLINLFSLAMPLALLQVYDRVIPNKSYGTITLLIAGVGVAILAEAIMRLARAHLMSMVGARFEHVAGISAVRQFLSCDITAFEREGSGVHIERFNALNQLREYYGGQAYMAVFDLPFIFLFIALVFYFGGELGLVLSGILFVYGLGVLIFGRRLANAVQRLQTADDDRIDYIIGTLRGIATLKVQAMEPATKSRYESFNIVSADEGHRVNQRMGSLGDFGFIMTQLAIVVVVGYGSTLVIHGQLSIGGLAACTLLAGRTMQPLNNIVGFWTRFQTIRSAQQRFDSIFSIPRGLNAPATESSNQRSKPLAPVDGALSLKDVHFRWPDSNDDLLAGIDLDVSKGEFVAITGPNGGGKSVLLALMRGFAPPTSGQVLIDGVALEERNTAEMEQAITYLPQNEVLFTGTILENLTTFRPDREHQGLAASELVGLSKWAQRLPDGYHTVVGAGTGEPLPRGLAQRIALARALVNDPKILLFDDANSAVDQAGDDAIKKVLRKLKGHTTVVVVSHRPSILGIADRILHLSGGVLSAQTASTADAVETGDVDE